MYSKRDLYERGHVAVCSHRQVHMYVTFVTTISLFDAIIILFYCIVFMLFLYDKSIETEVLIIKDVRLSECSNIYINPI